MSRRGVTPAVLLLAGAVAALAWLPVLGVTTAGYLGLAAAAALAWAWLAHRARSPRTRDHPWFSARGLLLGALLLRLPALFSTPWLSDDVYRYLWEGRVQRAGLSPYALAPADEALRPLRNETWQHVNHKDVSAAYPPAAQLLFRVMPESVAGFKALVVAADLAILGLLLVMLRRMGQAPAGAAWYAFHPLVALEFAGSGHLDALALAALVAALVLAGRARGLGTGLLTALGGLVKPPALVGGVALLSPRRWPGQVLLPLAMAALWWPFRADGGDLLRGLGEYRRHWEFNGFLFPWLRALLEQTKHWLEGRPADVGAWDLARELGYLLAPARHARHACEVLFLVLAVGAAWRLRADPWRAAGRVLVLQLLTAPTVHPWYVCWLVPFLVLRPTGAAATLTVTALVGSAAKVGEHVHGSWVEPAWLWWAVWLPPVLVWCGSWRGARGART